MTSQLFPSAPASTRPCPVQPYQSIPRGSLRCVHADLCQLRELRDVEESGPVAVVRVEGPPAQPQVEPVSAIWAISVVVACFLCSPGGAGVLVLLLRCRFVPADRCPKSSYYHPSPMQGGQIFCTGKEYNVNAKKKSFSFSRFNRSSLLCAVISPFSTMCAPPP